MAQSFKGRVSEAMEQALIKQRKHTPGYGVGVSFESDSVFLQWAFARGSKASELETVEVGFPPERADLARLLTKLNFAPKPGLEKHNIWEPRDLPLVWDREVGLVSYLADLLKALGASDQATLQIYP